MTNEEEDTDSSSSTPLKLARDRAHRRVPSTPSSLPGYRRAARHKTTASVSSALGSVAEDNPPVYTPAASNSFLLPSEGFASADEADAESEPTTSSYPYERGDRRRSFLRHHRSFSHRVVKQSYAPDVYESTNHDRTDSILARSVHALEMSNALLQSSMSTRASLSTAFLSPEDPPERDPFRIDAISRRFAASDNVDAQMEELLASAEDMVVAGPSISQSAPQMSTLHRHMASTSTSSQSRSGTSRYSQTASGCSTPKSPSPSHDLSPYLPLPNGMAQLPHTPTTPAYNLLSSIAIKSPPESRRGSSATRRWTPSIPDLRQGSTSTSYPRSRGDPSLCSRRRTRSTDSIRPGGERRRKPYPKSALKSVISPRFFEKRASSLLKGSTAAQAPSTPIAAETVARLRKILTADQKKASRVLPTTDPQTPPHAKSRPTISCTPPSSIGSPLPSPSPLRRELLAPHSEATTVTQSRPVRPIKPLSIHNPHTFRIPSSTSAPPTGLVTKYFRASRDGL